jgi:enoyl-CoA hydratase/carnithine racemase
LAVLRIALPESLGRASLDALGDALEAAAADPQAGAYVLHGDRPGVFCRGMDLDGTVQEGADPSASLRRFAACLSRLRRAPRPTIAVVDGDALGGGVGIAAACDLVLASPSASFSLPEALFGLLPGVVMPVLLERMAPQKARLLALRGLRVTASWAREQGLVDEIVPSEELDRAASRAARDLARVAPTRVLGLRSWLAEIPHLESDAALSRGAGVTSDLLRDPAVRERVRRYLEDGTPPWAEA